MRTVSALLIGCFNVFGFSETFLKEKKVDVDV